MRRITRRTTLFGVALAAAFTSACQDRLTDPESTGRTATSASTLNFRAPASLAESAPLDAFRGHMTDEMVVRLAADRAIDGDDYVCPPSTPVFDFLFAAIAEVQNDPEELATALYLQDTLLAFQIPQLEALVFLEEDRKAEYGYDGEFTNQINRTVKALHRFWDIPSDDIHVVPMKGSMLQDEERVSRVYQSPLIFGLPENVADSLAEILADTLATSVLLDGGDFPLFSFNAFAFDGIASFGIPPKVVMGDGIMDAYAHLGFGRVAPQGILGHEWAHHVQFANDYFNDPIPTLDPNGPDQAEATRYTELMADAMSAYFLTHKRGAALNKHRVAQFLEVFFQIGDCAFSNPGHHGTPNQRMAAAQFGFELADQAHKQGHIMTAEQVHDAFVAQYLDLIAPDAPDATAATTVASGNDDRAPAQHRGRNRGRARSR